MLWDSLGRFHHDKDAPRVPVTIVLLSDRMCRGTGGGVGTVASEAAATAVVFKTLVTLALTAAGGAVAVVLATVALASSSAAVAAVVVAEIQFSTLSAPNA
jgi:hypothetical protein